MAQRVKSLTAMREIQVRSLGWLATHSSILPLRISWTGEPGGLQSMGSKELDMTEQLHFHFHKEQS